MRASLFGEIISLHLQKAATDGQILEIESDSIIEGQVNQFNLTIALKLL